MDVYSTGADNSFPAVAAPENRSNALSRVVESKAEQKQIKTQSNVR